MQREVSEQSGREEGRREIEKEWVGRREAEVEGYEERKREK